MQKNRGREFNLYNNNKIINYYGQILGKYIKLIYVLDTIDFNKKKIKEYIYILSRETLSYNIVVAKPLNK